VSIIDITEEARARRAEFEAGVNYQCHAVAFADMIPGQPADPENPKEAEGMDHFRGLVDAALDAAGWDIFTAPNPPYDFLIQELFADAAICVDTLTGKYFKVPITMDGDAVLLGQPEEYDITFTPADAAPTVDGSEPVAEPITANRKFRAAAPRGATILKCQAGTKRPTYEITLTQSGWSADGRYITEAALEDAIARKLFDGVPCFYNHAPEDGGLRPDVPAGFVKPGTVKAEKNKAGGIDVVGAVALLGTDIGNDMQEVLDASLEIGTPLLGNSIYSKEAAVYVGEMDGRRGQIATKFITMNAVDFVDGAAYPRSHVTKKLAAAMQPRKDELTMDEKTELTTLRASAQENATKMAALDIENKRLKLERDVDLELQASGLPADEQGVQRPLLMKMDDKDVRAAHIALCRKVYLKQAPAGGAAVGTDGGTAPAARTIDPEVQAVLDANAKAAGIKPEFLARARAKRSGVPVTA
jgi:hypothetical protein